MMPNTAWDILILESSLFIWNSNITDHSIFILSKCGILIVDSKRKEVREPVRRELRTIGCFGRSSKLGSRDAGNSKQPHREGTREKILWSQFLFFLWFCVRAYLCLNPIRNQRAGEPVDTDHQASLCEHSAGWRGWWGHLEGQMGKV